MRQYPTEAMVPNRRSRKSVRKTIFAENKYGRKAAKAKARRDRQAAEKDR